MEPGTQVRLTSNPGQVGVLTGRSRKQGPITKLQVQFPDNAQYVPVGQLEVVEDGPEDPIDLLKAGKVGDLLYVAATRAKREVIVTCHDAPSPWLTVDRRGERSCAARRVLR